MDEPSQDATPPEPRLRWPGVLLLRVLFLAGALLAIGIGMPVDPSELVAKGGGSDDALRRRRYVVRRLRDEVIRPRDIGTQLDLFKGEYAFGTYAMAGYALTNVALDAPETLPESRQVLDLVLEQLTSSELSRFDAVQWGEPALESLDGDRGHIAYLGHLNLLLGCRRLLGGDTRHDALHARITAAISRRMRQRPHRHVETYPRETYTMDNVVAVASLAVADRVRGSDHRQLIGEYLAYTRSHLLDPRTGLVVFGVDEETGAPEQAGRGSAAGWASFFLPMIDRAFAREQYDRLREHLAGRLGPFAGVREYHPADPGAGLGDIDSGPVLVWGVSATGFSLAGARWHGDEARLAGQLSLAEVFGISVDHGDERRYVSAPLLGEAIMLAMKTARPWWNGMGEPSPPGGR